MAENNIRRKIGKLKRVLFNIRPEGHSPSYEANDHWVRDPKPYETVTQDGEFSGYDTGNIWRYYRFPLNVQTEFLKDPLDVIDNQHFFVDIAQDLAILLNNSADKTHRDPRREFHIQLTQDEGRGIDPYPGITPAKRDYFARMSEEVIRPIWHGYIGIRLIPSQMGNDEAYTTLEKTKRQIEMIRNPETVDKYLYKKDREEVDKVMLSNGFSPLDFSTEDGEDDYNNLTAWHGLKDDDYNLPRELVNTRVSVPVHGKSIKTPRWGELSFYAIKPMDSMFMVDPKDNIAQWGKAIYSPRTNVVVANIRGQIRKSEVAKNIYTQQSTIRREKRRREQMKNAKRNVTEEERSVSQINRLEEGERAAESGHPLLDNVEITAGIKIIPGSPSSLPNALRRYGLKAAPLQDRQAAALMNTFPCYPKPIFPVSMSNTRRNPAANQMYPGILAMSGIFRHTKAAASQGLLLGLTDANNEYLPVMSGIEDANKKHSSPGFLVTGRPGAGKTMQLLQMIAQAYYDNYRGVFLNPKKDSTLKPFFDHINGVTINMNESYLDDNPGMLDPVFYLVNRDEVASLLTENLEKILGIAYQNDPEINRIRTKMTAEIKDRARDRRNRTSYDIIFGNPSIGTEPITNSEFRETIEDKINSSPFWKSFIARDENAGSELREKMDSGHPVLIEWDKSLQVPEGANAKMTTAQQDSLMSVQTVFQYAVEITGQDRAGGTIVIDEAWILKSSAQAMRMVNGSLREFREANIMLVLATQRLLDFMNDEDSSGDADFTSYFSRFLIMAIHSNDKREIEKFFELTELPRTRRWKKYITEAGIESEEVDERGNRTRENKLPRAWFKDDLNDFEGGIVCGPWPEQELAYARTDKEGGQYRRSMSEDDDDGGLSEFFSPSLIDTMYDDGSVNDALRPQSGTEFISADDDIIDEYRRENEKLDFFETAERNRQSDEDDASDKNIDDDSSSGDSQDSSGNSRSGLMR